MKRARDAEETAAVVAGAPAREEKVAVEVEEQGEDSEEEELRRVARRAGGPAVRKGADCPYLDTISRQNLDFDFEKCCSVSLSPVNVYACLVCGKYFQVPAPLSPHFPKHRSAHLVKTEINSFLIFATLNNQHPCS
jgi:hypothetical protein